MEVDAYYYCMKLFLNRSNYICLKIAISIKRICTNSIELFEMSQISKLLGRVMQIFIPARVN